VSDSTGGHFNLSRNKSIRVLETTTESIVPVHDTASEFFGNTLSSITHSALLDVVIVYQETDFSEVVFHLLRKSTRPHPFNRRHEFKKGIPQNRQQQFEVFREMHKVRDFRLVFCADILDCGAASGAMKMLKHFVKKEKKQGGLNYLLHEPLVISGRRTVRTRRYDHITGWSVNTPVRASAL